MILDQGAFLKLTGDLEKKGYFLYSVRVDVELEHNVGAFPDIRKILVAEARLRVGSGAIGGNYETRHKSLLEVLSTPEVESKVDFILDTVAEFHTMVRILGRPGDVEAYLNDLPHFKPNFNFKRTEPER